jgi:hypothetical protein
MVQWHDDRFNCYSASIGGFLAAVSWASCGGGWVCKFAGNQLPDRHACREEAQRAVEAFARAKAEAILRDLEEERA